MYLLSLFPALPLSTPFVISLMGFTSFQNHFWVQTFKCSKGILYMIYISLYMFILHIFIYVYSPMGKWLSDEESACQCRRCPGGGNSNRFQYSHLRNPTDSGACWAPVYGVTKSQTWLKDWAWMHMCIYVHILYIYHILYIIHLWMCIWIYYIDINTHLWWFFLHEQDQIIHIILWLGFN